MTVPLIPLDGEVLLPGHRLDVSSLSSWLSRGSNPEGSDGPVAAALRDEDSVHEIGVIANLEKDEDSLRLHGLSRCRLLAMVQDSLPTMVQVERLSEPQQTGRRSDRLADLLRRRFLSLRRQLGKPGPTLGPDLRLSPLTWTVIASLGLSADQQQGFLNLADPLDRGRLLLLAIRELGQRERFLRPWAHLRDEYQWN